MTIKAIWGRDFHKDFERDRQILDKVGMEVSQFDLNRVDLTDAELKELDTGEDEENYVAPCIDIYWIEDDQEMFSELDVFVPIEYSKYAERIMQSLVERSSMDEGIEVGDGNHMYEEFELIDGCTILKNKYYRYYTDNRIVYQNGSNVPELAIGVTTGHFVHYELKHFCSDCTCRYDVPGRSMEGFFMGTMTVNASHCKYCDEFLQDVYGGPDDCSNDPY